MTDETTQAIRAAKGRARFHALVDEFLAVLAREKNYSAHTIKSYRRDLLRFAGYLEAEGLDWGKVEAKHVRDYVAHRFTGGVADRTLQRELSSLRGFYRHCMATGAATCNPTLGVRPPRTGRKLPETLTIEQVESLLKSLSEDALVMRDVAVIELAYSSGLRLSELVGVNLGDLDLDAGAVRVVGKGSKQRDLPVGRHACRAIRCWLKLRTQFARDGEEALFVSRRGRRLSPRSVQKRLAEHAARCGLGPRLHPHVLRHSFASHLLESSGDLRAVQELLGHSNIGTTQIYTHLDFQHLAKVYDKAHPRARRRSAKSRRRQRLYNERSIS